jgi:branched-subunit amino acid transport protein
MHDLGQEIWLVLGMAAVTFSIRYGLLAMSGRMTLPPTIVQALQYVPPAVLTAIIVPIVILPEGRVWVNYDNARLVGALATLGIAFWQKNLLVTIVAGMIVFLLYQVLLLQIA